MSIKDLFNNPGTKKIQKTATSDELVENVESIQYVEAKKQEFDQFVPPIDFTTASNFAKFGSAELYYEKAFERIHDYYPYDGTLAEKTEFHNSSSYLDKHVFDNLYPRTNGYVQLGLSSGNYITAFGGPHTASSGMLNKTLESTFENSMVYDESKKRTSAFEFRGDDGVTIEFWLNVPSATNKTIMHVTGAGAGEIKLELRSSDELRVQIGSGSSGGTANATVLQNVVAGASNVWNHYAVTIHSSSVEGLIYRGYKNGQLNKTTVKSGAGYNIPTILPATNGLNMTVAADSDGTNRLVCKLDEFRYWKKARTPEQIYNNWFVPIGGGTNKNDANIDLGLYFKFNEGITGDSSIDEVILDYSGRINNGKIVTYDSTMRNTGSAIREKLGESEFLDPIIYSTHPDVVAKKAEHKLSGSLADKENSSMMLSYFPSWMQEEDEQNGKQLKYLAQVLGSYFDTLWHQIDFVDKIHDHHYISGSNKALPFSKKLLYNRGFVVPDLFADATIIENLLGKDDNEVYEKQINEVRNTIYHNLYNNLDAIYKSKGSEKSFRNFFRSLGIGQDVVKLRMYADDSTFVLRNNYEHRSYERKYLNFNQEGHFDATLFSTSSANNSNHYIPGDTDYLGSFTFETEIILPRKNRLAQYGIVPFSGLTASVAGFHTLGTAYVHPTPNREVSVYVLKEATDTSLNPDESHRVRFMLKGAFGELISETYNYQYENNKWNLAVRLRHENYPYGNVVGNVSNNYIAEFYGVEADGSTKRNSFYLSSSITANYFTDSKIFYAGAKRADVIDTLIYGTDIKLGFARYWHSYLSNDAIDQHAYDSETFGANEPFENDLVDTNPYEVPREKTLAFHWAFNDLTTSDGAGELLVSDLSSGSTDSNYGPISDTIQRYNQGKAIGFNANSQKALDKMYIQAARKRQPDDLMSSDLTIIKSEPTELFFVDDDVSDNFYSFEKSLYGTISDEMMNMFSTALDLNNLIGQPNQKYHHRYNLADFLRDRFYDDVENEPDVEKFTSFYKWIDDSISIALRQLVPASARSSDKIIDVIESHVLERNKYVHQVPILTTFQSTEGSIKGITEMKYDWKHGHAPFFPDEEQTNALWQRERKVRSDEVSGLRETLRVSKNNHSIQSSGLRRREIAGSTRISDVYAIRKFAKTYDLSMVSKPPIHGGVNFERSKNIQLFHESIAPAGGLGSTSGVPQNIITVGVGEENGLVRETRDDDNLPRKKKFNSNALVGNREGSEYGYGIKGNMVLPLNLMSGTVHSGYNHEVKSNFAADVVLANLHHDSVGNNNETSIQGPFTNAHVGGLQYRHIDINRYDTSKSVGVLSRTGGTFPSASIQFTPNVLSSKLAAGTGSFVTIRDGDGTTITALYSDVYDLYDNQWTNMDQLVFIINNKLDMTTNKASDSFLSLTQSVTGNFYNYTIQASSHGFITASGFNGGTPITSSVSYVNIDGPENRPEGWGLVFKDHPSQGDSDGSFGFIGADYSTPYPSSVKLKATRYREETAKRPVNIRNIKTTSGSLKAGNYSNEIQIFSVAHQHQKTWAVEAYDDPDINIIPESIADSLPQTTHYQSMLGVSPLEQGNTFGVYGNNRQPDAELLVNLVPGTTATGSFVVTGSPSPPANASGSFEVTGTHVDGTSAAGSFKFYSSDTQGFQTINDWNLNQIQFGGKSFTLTASNPSDTSSQFFFVTGANSGSTYTNLRNEINAAHNGVYTAGYTETIPPGGRGLNISASYSNPVFLSASEASNGGKYNQNAYSWVFNLAVSDNSPIPTHDEYIFSTLNSGGSAVSQELFITSSNGDLIYRVHFTGGQTRTWSTGSFKSALNRHQMYNLILTHDYPSGAPGASDAAISLDGVDLPLTFAFAGGAVGNAQSLKVPSAGDLFLFSAKGSNNTNFVGTASVAAFFKDAIGPTNRQFLYNQGFIKDYSFVRNVSNFLVTQWKLEPTNDPTVDGDIFTALTGSDLINLTASIRVPGQMVTAEAAGLAEEPYATFNITADLTGSAYNGAFTINATPSEHNYFDDVAPGGLNGGTNEAGLIFGNKIVVGSKNFIVAATASTDTSSNFYVVYTGSSPGIWNSLQSKIIANTEVTSINRVDTGFVSSVFSLTSSLGTAGNVSINLAGDVANSASFKNPVGMQGGLNYGSLYGIQDGDHLNIADPTGRRFILTSSAPSDTSTLKYIEITGTSAAIWTALENKIESAVSPNILATVNTSAGHSATFSLAGAATGSSRNHTLSENGNSFTSLLGMAGGTNMIPATFNLQDNTITRPRTDLTGSERNIATRFSAPGGPEIQSISYLDAYTSTYSVHNAMPFRNLSILGSGSGESATIRVEDHLGKRRGLKTLRALHMGQFGIDSTHGSITSTSYPTNGSFNKQQRNPVTRYVWNSSADITASQNPKVDLITSNAHDNMHINTPIPRSEFQYSWIRSTVSGSGWLNDVLFFGYAPTDGFVSASLGYAEAINFPTGSTIFQKGS